ncbi:MAG: ABC transporter substrate-binding protein [Betaproteobacteria bacterium]|nr:ABC transporter substrate-binding protein [Betaproteobacteria bacterium]
MKGLITIVALVLPAVLGGCSGPWNDPYPAQEAGKNILYSSFSERPKHLDPVQSYAENEAVFTAQIYMPPLQYHYLKRPYELTTLAATDIPKSIYYDASDRKLPETAPGDKVAYSVYEIHIRPGIMYQPHPALAKDETGKYRYHQLAREDLRHVYELSDFKYTGTRELVADDYAFQIRRLAHPKLHSPIFGLISEYIVGLKDYAAKLQQAAKTTPKDGYLDLMQFPLDGVQVVDSHTYRIRLKGKYPQFVYWLAMPFFAPVPWEAERFYSQPGMTDGKNLSLDWYPIGTGAYMLTVNDPNRMMVMERNPNFAGEPYPSEGEAGDKEEGLLDDAGKTMPFVDKAVFSLEKEAIPYWNKFLQGYYDASGITSDSFDQTIQMTSSGEVALVEGMRNQGIRLQTSVATSVMYMGFNMLDPIVGGESERNRKLRQAISIAIDQEEFISIFTNGRGIPGQGPIPPGIFGYRDGKEGMNPYVYDWVDGKPQRKSDDYAKKLLAEAGYPNGIDKATGKPLIIYFDTTLSGVGGKSRIDWLTKQFQKIDLQMVVRNSDFNRFQDKIRKGTAQLFFFGWNADYPDPENFLFLFYGPQSRVKSGENAANYANPEFDRMFDRMQVMENGPERQALIDRMVEILRNDAPWVYMLYPKDYTLAHAWVYNRKPNKMANNGLKYQRIDPRLRENMRAAWNHPVTWPIVALLAVLALALTPAVMSYRNRERASGKLRAA